MKNAVTITEIAKQLGLSRNTVAKALNGKYVPNATRTRVLEKARELNYKSMGDSANDYSDSKRILLLSGRPLTNMSYFVPIIKSIENICYEKRHELFQHTYNSDMMSFRQLAEYIKGLDIDGIIAIETFDKELISKIVTLAPTSFIDFSATSVPPIGNYDVIQTNSQTPILAITHGLYEKYGIKRFTFVGDITHCRSFRDRYFGMLLALSGNGIPHSRQEDILRSDKFNYGSTEGIKSEIIKLRNLPECFICANDFIARSVCNTLAQMNVPVPQKCMVVGYDNSTNAISASPTITTFGCDNENLGREAVGALLYRLSHKSLDYTRQITVGVRKFTRQSTER